MTLPRVLTTVILAPIVVLAVWVGHFPYFVLVCGICLFCYWEYSQIAKDGGYPNQFWIGMVGTFLVVVALYLGGVPSAPFSQSPHVGFILFLIVMAVFLREFFRKDKGLSYLTLITTFMGIFLCSFCLGHLLLIRDLKWISGEGFQYAGREATFFLFVVIWMVDIGAWLVGKTWGRIRLAPLLSPRKTWEGCVGGVLMGCVAGWFFREAFTKTMLSSMEAVGLAFFISVFAQISDLSESLIKRSFGVRDSSPLLPGHGGMFDRFDSFLFSAPFYYYALLGLGRFQ